MYHAVVSRETGAASRLWVSPTGDICSEQGDSCAPQYIHSELFGGYGHVDPVGDVPEVLTQYLSVPPRVDRRTFGY